MINDILKKINKVHDVEFSKVELAKHEIALALADELKLNVKYGTAAAASFAKNKAIIEKSINSMKAAVEDVRINKDWGKKTLANAQKFKGQLDKLAKELGVNLQGSEPDKLLSELFMLAEDGQGDIDAALAILNTLK